MTGLKLEELNWGICNDLVDTNQAQITGDPRRTTPVKAVQRMTQAAFAPDAIGARDEYNGFVVSSQEINYATYRNRASMLQSYAAPAAQNSGQPTEYDNIAYKVYIPELMPQPPPPSTVTPEEAARIFATYPDVFPELEINEKIPHGSLVTVRYENPQYLTNPRIVNIIERAVGVVIAGESISGQYARGAPYRSRSGLGHSGPAVQSPTTDDGSFSWSNRAKQITGIIWHAPVDSAYASFNGTELKNGDLDNTPAGFFKNVRGAKLVAPAADKFLALSNAFKAKFGFPLKGSGYRSYEGQVGARLKRVTGDVNGCCPATRTCSGEGQGPYQYLPEREHRRESSSGSGRVYVTMLPAQCLFVGTAATPGRSNHGWGAAVDLKGKTSGLGSFACGPDGQQKCSSKRPQDSPPGMQGIFRRNSVYFQWINKFSLDFDFVYNINERWHLNWTGVNSHLQNLPVSQKVSLNRYFPGPQNGLTATNQAPTFGPPRTA